VADLLTSRLALHDHEPDLDSTKQSQ
jgi:hypothetical protein